MTSFQCKPSSLASTLCSCLCCFFLVYKPARVAIQFTKTPQVLAALAISCCCMSSQTITVGNCAYEAIVPEKKEED